MTQAEPQAIELSFFEWRAQVAKAARGSGRSWGLAEEAGWAAEWLVRRGLPAAGWVGAWLHNGGGGACPVAFGASLSDRCAGDTASRLPVLPAELPVPGLLLPFMWRCAAGREAIALHGPEGLAARVDAADEVTFGPAWGGVARGWTLRSETVNPPVHAGPEPRLVVTVAMMQTLADLAMRTTVPASETSRADAGASTGDND